MSVTKTTPDPSSRSQQQVLSPILRLPGRVVRKAASILRNCRWRFLGYDYLKINDTVRLKIHADSRIGHLLRYGDFEAAELTFLRRYLRPGDSFIDAGANVGLYTLLAGVLVGSSGRVFAFEPASATFRRLMENVRNSGLSQVSCHQMALSDAPGKGALSVSETGFDAWNSLAGSLTDGPTGTESVTLTTWDDFAKLNGVGNQITAIKIDVEGWELPVLTGMSRLLEQNDAPLLQVEFTATNASAAGGSCEMLFDAIQRFGYQLYRFDSVSQTLAVQTAAPTEGHCNLYAIKDISSVNQRLQESSC